MESISWDGGSGNKRKGIDTRTTSKKDTKGMMANGLLGNSGEKVNKKTYGKF